MSPQRTADANYESRGLAQSAPQCGGEGMGAGIQRLRQGRILISNGAYQASKRLMEAEQEFPSAPDEKSGAVKDHFERIRDLARVQHWKSVVGRDRGSAGQNLRRRSRALGRAGQRPVTPRKAKKPARAEDMSKGAAKTRNRSMILAKLDEPISMSFAEETPLEDVLKYVKQATTTKTYAGIPIYVDPVGLQEAEKSMTSTVRNMDLEGVPLRRTLQLLLKQLDLIYFVDDGILYITSAESEDPWGRFGPAIAEPSPILQRAEKAKRGELSLSEMKELLELLKTREQIMKLEAGEAEHGQDVAQSNKEKEEAKQDRETMKQLLKEMRELIQVLKADKQTKSAAEGK